MKIMSPAKTDSLQLDESAYYRELTSRNHHFVEEPTQLKISGIDVLVAGCGSTGGACIEALARLGVKNFRIADNGSYELTNLNRQHARLDALGKNKAKFHAEEIRGIQPYATLSVYPEGLTRTNLEAATSGATFVIDAIDVTTPAGLEMKIALHGECAKRRLPVFTALDIGYRQWGKSFDYRKGNLAPLGGAASIAQRKSHPLSALFTLYSLDAVPDHALDLIEDLLENRTSFASQLGSTSDLLSSIIVAATIRLVESGDLLPGWSIDLWRMKEGRGRSFIRKIGDRLAKIRQRRRISRGIREDRYRVPLTSSQNGIHAVSRQFMNAST